MATGVALLAAVLTFISTGPQLLRTLHNVAGLSASAWLQNTAIGLLWAFYGVQTDVWALAVSEGAFTLGSAIVFVRLVAPARAVWTLLAAAAAVVCLYLFLGPSVCLLGATGASLLARGSQISHMVRARAAAGVALTTWAVLSVNNLLWALAGTLRQDATLAVSACSIGLSSVAVIVVARHISKVHGPGPALDAADSARAP